MTAIAEVTITRVGAPAGPHDAVRPLVIDAVTAIDRATAESPWSAATFASEFARDDRYYCIATIDDEVVGFAGFAVLAGDAHIMAIAVRPDCQRRGVGRRLLSALLDEADRWGVDGVTLEVREDDMRTRTLYERAGFVEEGRRANYYGDGVDAIIAWKR